MFTRRILTHKKIIFIFLLLIFLPLLIAGYLSLSTFPKRREAIKQLLESNLWISGEVALQSIEGELLEYEQKALKSENFTRLIQSKPADKVSLHPFVVLEDTVGQLFLLDADFHIVYPEMASENDVGIPWKKEIQNNQFVQSFQQAEYLEFSQKNYIRAAELYKECASYAPSEQYYAIALEGLGRCLLSSKKYDEAYSLYNELYENYGQLQNRTGHPYGIVALFQLYEIARGKKEVENSIGILLTLYEQIREGIWLVQQPVFDFYVAEIESILNNELNDGKFPEIQKTYIDKQRQISPYSQVLVFADFLERNAVPEIKEKISMSRTESELTSGRFLCNTENDLCLISYAILSGFQFGHTFYGGLFWDLNRLKNQIITKNLEDIAKETELDIKIIEEGSQNITSEQDALTSGESLTLAFRTFPLPWKILVSHLEIKALEKTAQRDILLYGILLAVIAAFMLLGAVLIARDISRESETTRLKTEFVNTISHELKTPLTLIRLYGETLQRKENLTDKDRKECYEIITKESERLSHLINNVLDFSRIEMGRKEFDYKRGNLQDVIRDTLESYHYHLEKKGFVIKSDIASDLPQMNFDGEAIASLLINLLSNAMKFSPKKKEVNVKLFRDNGNAVLQVSDKGIGIAQKEIPKIFERFFQSENNIASEARGSGLGLTLVKHIAEAHNGRTQVESEVGKGSTFSVMLPISNAENEKQDKLDPGS